MAVMKLVTAMIFLGINAVMNALIRRGGFQTGESPDLGRKQSGGAKLRISALRFCIFRAQWNLAICPGIVPLNFRESLGKDTICKMLKLQAWKSQSLTSENVNLPSPETVSGELAENFQGSSGKFRGSPGTSQKLGGVWLPPSDSPNLSPTNVSSISHALLPWKQRLLRFGQGIAAMLTAEVWPRTAAMFQCPLPRHICRTISHKGSPP